MKISNVLVVCTEKIASVTVGVLNILEALQQKNKVKVKFLCTGEVTEEDILWCDTFVDVRGSEALDCYYVELCRLYQRQTVYFLDDDLLNVPKEASCYAYYQSRWTIRHMIKLFHLCDILWCVNTNISHKYSCYFERTVVADTCVLRKIEGISAETGKVRVLYAGGIDHEKMIQASISPVVRRICSNYGNKVEFTFIGADPALQDVAQVKHIRYSMDYEQYRNTVENGKFDIAFAVIPDTEFYRCKYYNKYLEYSSIGAVGIYTKSEPYTFIINHGYNGLLVNNDEWYEAFSYLIENEKERNAMREKAYQMLLARFSPEAAGEKLMQLFPELFSYVAPQKKVNLYIKKWKYAFEMYIQKVDVCIKEYGIRFFFFLPIKAVCYIVKRIRGRKQDSSQKGV